MNAERIVDYLLDVESAPPLEALVGEASIHLPHRGTKWVAAFRDENGHPVWRSTGMLDRKQAQAMADEWEAEAKMKRADLGVETEPKIRVRAGGGGHALALLSQKEVAVIMKISERAVRSIERRALEKLRNHPVLKQILREWEGRQIGEAEVTAEYQLTQAEMGAVLGLARTPFERFVTKRVLRIVAQP